MLYPYIKRSIDISASAAALILLLPLLALIALLIRCESPGSALFLQERIGQYGIPFRILKFRSMVHNAPALGSWQTADNDPRITRVGHFLRLTSLDELPQLWNVLKGDMSLVGPRPAVAHQQALYQPADWEKRHRVKPGITGLAQVNGRSQLSDAQQLAYELAYADHPSFAVDMMIMLKTVWLVLRRTGVN